MNKKNRNFMLLLIVVFVLNFIGCITSPNERTQLTTYHVVSIDSISINEFIIRKDIYDYPISISIDYPNNSKGNVVFYNINKKGIQKFIDDKSFIIELDNEIESVEFVYFSSLVISNEVIKGQFSFGGPTIDTPSHTFVAQKNMWIIKY